MILSASLSLPVFIHFSLNIYEALQILMTQANLKATWSYANDFHNSDSKGKTIVLIFLAAVLFDFYFITLFSSYEL